MKIQHQLTIRNKSIYGGLIYIKINEMPFPPYIDSQVNFGANKLTDINFRVSDLQYSEEDQIYIAFYEVDLMDNNKTDELYAEQLGSSGFQLQSRVVNNEH